MGLDGGGGGGGGILGVTGSFTGPATALEIAGFGFAYAYSGGINLNNESKNFLEFRTGNFLLVAEVQTTVKLGGLNLGKKIQTTISLNGSPIIDMGTKGGITTSSFDDFPTTLNIIVPPYTQVQVAVFTDDTEGDQPFYVTLTGRIYRE